VIVVIDDGDILKELHKELQFDNEQSEITVASEIEFKNWLRKIFSSAKTMRIITALLAQSNKGVD